VLRGIAPPGRESIYETVVSKLKRRMRTLRVGDPLDKNTDVGAINSKQQLDKIGALVRRASTRAPRSTSRRASSRAAVLVRRPSHQRRAVVRVAQEEIFGPVLSVLTFRTPDEAIEKANNTPVRDSPPAVWTEKGSRSSRWPSAQAGVVWANTITVRSGVTFGGYKDLVSGEGGRHGLESYVALDDA